MGLSSGLRNSIYLKLKLRRPATTGAWSGSFEHQAQEQDNRRQDQCKKGCEGIRKSNVQESWIGEDQECAFAVRRENLAWGAKSDHRKDFDD